ncbi:peptidoglycan DD-metalloendopeptidase family protein [Pseudorhodoplanes sp.]|uniref:peptidoglycan DD-metalloendopeptidase family protein n=1 Tax=Pseudorhodoplanes sp. TaxID=1934341 RepID=UPI002C27649A|nr:peptidoglycan DD-metalloendopeptidase family protein [Pseudorhodoplanes sp.]HWV52573.1 peptidoglycan DD-metalloendopeptidase family protein [Pseudorhodoplanes sp.]
MSYRPHSHHPNSHHHPDQWAYEYPRGHHPQPHQAHAPQTRAQHQTAQSHAQSQKQQRRRSGWADYTLIHGRRQVRLGPVAFWIVVGSLVVMAGWSILTGTYFAFHDDVLKRLIARQAEMQYAYEDRIAELRAQVDRIASRQLLDQEQFEQKLEALVRKQSVLEQRAATLSSLPDYTPTGSIPKPARGSDASKGPNAKPSPINDTVIFRAPPDREARLESRTVPAVNLRNSAKTRGGVEGALARMQESLDRIEAKQSVSLSALEENFESRARRIRSVLTDLGINPGKALPPAPPPPSGVGGPFVPANLASDEKSFERQLYRIHVSRSQVDRLTRTLLDVPVRKPVSGEIDLSSSFGTRVDPFLRSPAMHTGLDMRGDTGDPVRATANGTVTIAGNNGGYGKMIEIEHKNGLATRYGHLSAIDVKVGQSVKIGQVIGKIGSTGRSTGPHLHYETRVDGEAVDPQKYLRAGIRLGLN